MSWRAQYDGTCEKCGGPIKVGQPIEWADAEERTIQHPVCPPMATPCPKCYLVHAGECF